jgi:hypothetical protein
VVPVTALWRALSTCYRLSWLRTAQPEVCKASRAAPTTMPIPAPIPTPIVIPAPPATMTPTAIPIPPPIASGAATTVLRRRVAISMWVPPGRSDHGGDENSSHINL